MKPHYTHEEIALQDTDQAFLDIMVNSSAAIFNCQDMAQLTECIHQTIQDLALSGNYRLDINRQVNIEFFQGGRLVHKTGQVPQRGCHQEKLKIVDLEKALIFKLPCVQFNIAKSASILQNLSLYKSLILIWLQQINGWCSQIQSQQYVQALQVNRQIKLKENIEAMSDQLGHRLVDLSRQQIEVAEGFDKMINHEIEQGNEHTQALITALQDQSSAVGKLIHLQDDLSLFNANLLKSVTFG